MPIIINQLIDFVKQASHILSSLKTSLEELSIKYPTILTEDRINSIVSWFDSIDWKKLAQTLDLLFYKIPLQHYQFYFLY